MAYREKDTKKWTAQWFETNVMGEKKKRRKRGFETKREALEFERSKKLSNERSMDMKLSDFIEIYFSDKQNDLKDRTIKNKRYMMQQHIVPYFGNQMMSEIKASQIIQWQNEIQKKGYSDSYLRMIQNQLTSLFTHAAKIYDLPVNPCKKVKRMGNSDSRSLNFWTLDGTNSSYRQWSLEQGIILCLRCCSGLDAGSGSCLRLQKLISILKRIGLVSIRLITGQECRILSQNRKQNSPFGQSKFRNF